MNDSIDPRLLSRRRWLSRHATGFGMTALAGMLAGNVGIPALGAAGADAPVTPPFRPRAKHVIFLFMDGGMSQVDTFDPKPRLETDAGKPFPMKIDATQFDQIGNMLPSLWPFRNRGESGLPVSDLFPHLARHADDLCVIRSLTSEFPEHAQACYFVHTGSGAQGRPSMGAWASYGLGTDNEDLPGFVVLNGGMIPLGGVGCYASGFLPAEHTGAFFHVGAEGPIVENIVPGTAPDRQRMTLDFIRSADDEFRDRLGFEGRAVESAIRTMELAAAMQREVPEVADLSRESAATKALYGIDSPDPFLARYAKEALIARRLIERGVRFVELTMVHGLRFVSPWDSHGNLREEHGKCARTVDRPIAALIHDLKARGLWNDTLLVCAGEFGRTPFAQGKDGRDHNPQGFSCWLAGGAVKGGMAYGATDEFGYRAVSDVVTMHDLHATILHILGMDHTRLTYRFGGRDYRLTDVFGNVVEPILA
ncbi:DUF1501 domain-containing protein [bacterium]|nr:DUF1501 domain-containing protein [bacterium]